MHCCECHTLLQHHTTHWRVGAVARRYLNVSNNGLSGLLPAQATTPSESPLTCALHMRLLLSTVSGTSAFCSPRRYFWDVSNNCLKPPVPALLDTGLKGCLFGYLCVLCCCFAIRRLELLCSVSLFVLWWGCCLQFRRRQRFNRRCSLPRAVRVLHDVLPESAVFKQESAVLRATSAIVCARSVRWLC